MKKIIIERGSDWYAIFRTLKIMVDGKEVTNIKRNTKLDLQVDRGSRELCGKMDWAETSSIALPNVEDGSTITFSVQHKRSMADNMGLSGLPFDVTANPPKN
ncbi:MAG: hypothetical protein AAGE18_14500 [Pseudomonadota bacterium]